MRNFDPCEDCPLNRARVNTPILVLAKAMGEIYTGEDYDRMYDSLSRADRRVAEDMEHGAYPTVDGANCDGPTKAFLVGKLTCRGYAG